MKVLTVSGIVSERKKLIPMVNDYDTVVTSYDLLKRDIAEYDDKNFLYQIIRLSISRIISLPHQKPLSLSTANTALP